MFTTLNNDLNDALGIFTKAKAKLTKVVKRAEREDKEKINEIQRLKLEEERLQTERRAIGSIILQATNTTQKLQQLVGEV